MAKKKKATTSKKAPAKKSTKKSPKNSVEDVRADLDTTYAVVRIELDEESEFLSMPDVYSGHVGGKHIYDFQITDPEEWRAFLTHVLTKAAPGSYFLRVVEPLG